MQMQSNDKLKVYGKNSKKIGYYLPIIFIIVIIPLITFGKIIELPTEEANFWKGGTTHVDFFYYYKSIALLIGTTAALIAYGGLYLNNKLPLQKEKKFYIPMLIYSLVVILSAVFSQNKHVAFEGFIEMYQGVFVLICYIMLFFIMINYTVNERDIKVVIYSLAVLTIAEGILGLGQYFGYDFFKSSLGQWIITPNVLRNAELKFTFGKYTIYGTMYNTNYVGSFGAMVLPLTTILYIYSRDKINSITFCLTASLAYSTWLGSNSRAGYLGVIVALILGCIVFRNVIKVKLKKVLILLFCFLIITVAFNIVSNGKVTNEFMTLNPINEAQKIKNVQENQTVRFDEIYAHDNTFMIKTDEETLILLVNDSKLVFIDEQGNKLGIHNDNGKISFTDDKYSEYKFTLLHGKSSRIKADIYGRNLDLYIMKDDQIKVISINNKLTVPVKAPRIELFDGKETFASKRGYIWSRSIPMIKNTIFIGYGPDNYPMMFPQEDYVGRFNTGNGMTDIVIDKPHNLYLQAAINTGLISLLALLTIWAIYLFDSFKIYINRHIDSFAEYIGGGIFLSISAYLVAGLFNDSVISVAPLFWILLGLGIGINRIVNSKKNNV